MTIRYVGFLLAVILVCSVGSLAVEKRGAEKMILSGGKRGSVPFPHARHQTVLVDCMICHTYFPQQPGIIQKLKEEGKLKKKQVMKHCTTCHRKRSKAGQKAGPLRCKTCHQR